MSLLNTDMDMVPERRAKAVKASCLNLVIIMGNNIKDLLCSCLKNHGEKQALISHSLKCRLTITQAYNLWP